MKIQFKLTLLTTIAFVSCLSLADEYGEYESSSSEKKVNISKRETNWWKQRHRGWKWFEDRDDIEEEAKQEPREEEPNNIIPMPTRKEIEEAKEKIKKDKQELDDLRALTFAHPKNRQYAYLYRKKEKKMMDDATTLGETWKSLSMMRPELADKDTNPTNMYGEKINKQIEKDQEEEILKSIGDSVELFVYRTDGCPHCETLERHLKTFATRYNLETTALTNDGSTSKYFKTEDAPAVIERLKLRISPTVILIDKKTNSRVELARGAVSIEDLREATLYAMEFMMLAAENPEKFKEVQKMLNPDLTVEGEQGQEINKIKGN